MSSETPTQTGSQAVERALAILELLRNASGELGVHEIARRLNLRPPTVHRLLQALARHGLVQRHPTRRTYGLGWKLVDYANVVIHNTQYAAEADDIVKGLRDLTGETAALQVRVGFDRVCVVEYESHQDLRRSMGVGRRIPLHAGSSGRAILAFLEPGELSFILKTSPPRPSNDYDVLEISTIHRLLEETRQTGYAQSEPREERVAGIAALSTPFFQFNGIVAGALSISGPSVRWTRAARQRYVPDLLRAGQELSRRLGSQRWFPWYERSDAAS
ncbi:MAG TPA: IclR family transcriptional regulator [Thermomicrobiales bacterium]